MLQKKALLELCHLCLWNPGSTDKGDHSGDRSQL
jgi:hypothetical protein